MESAGLKIASRPGDHVTTFTPTAEWQPYVLAVKLPDDIDPAKGMVMFVDLLDKNTTVHLDDCEFYVTD